MPPPGRSRESLARVLSAAFAEGLLSEQTLTLRLGLLFGAPLVDSHGLIGDLSLRAPTRGVALGALRAAGLELRRALSGVALGTAQAGPLLALDWSGAVPALLIGRDEACDVVLGHSTVSRRHAQLTYRGGVWIVADLGSLNGTTVNGTAVGRCRLRPGDRLALGAQSLLVD